MSWANEISQTDRVCVCTCIVRLLGLFKSLQLLAKDNQTRIYPHIECIRTIHLYCANTKDTLTYTPTQHCIKKQLASSAVTSSLSLTYSRKHTGLQRALCPSAFSFQTIPCINRDISTCIFKHKNRHKNKRKHKITPNLFHGAPKQRAVLNLQPNHVVCFYLSCE